MFPTISINRAWYSIFLCVGIAVSFGLLNANSVKAEPSPFRMVITPNGQFAYMANVLYDKTSMINVAASFNNLAATLIQFLLGIE